LLRAYRHVVADTASKKVRKRLRRLARSTGAGRDAEVQLAWLRDQKSSMSASQKPGWRWLMRRLKGRRTRGYEQALRQAKEFLRLSDTLKRRLRLCKTRTPAHQFRLVAGALLAEHISDLRILLSRVPSSTEIGAALTIAGAPPSTIDGSLHAVRISGKRVRYLIEPFRRAIDGCPRLIEALKELQDLLGELHDMHLLSTEITGAQERARADEREPRKLRKEALRVIHPGLCHLSERVTSRFEQLFRTLDRDWLKGRADDLLAGLGDLKGKLVARVSDGQPQGNHEIERKYLLKRLPGRVQEFAKYEIEQGWLPGDLLQDRLRRVKSPDGERYFRTVKVGMGLSRLEVEEETSQEVFVALWELTRGRRVRKYRYRIPVNGLTWEVDDFSDRELTLAEVEIPNLETKVELPGWLVPLVVREVTGEEEYYNVNLAI